MRKTVELNLMTHKAVEVHQQKVIKPSFACDCNQNEDTKSKSIVQF